ncbi:hypothetical protein K8R78_03430 [bacterium]|nr:hypothetical protein [bacterium]
MAAKPVYQERVFSLVSNLVFLVVVAGLVIFAFIPLGDGENLSWLFFSMAGLCFLVGLCLSHVRVILTDEGFCVGMCVFKLKRPWSAVTAVHRDTKGGMEYGGWGVKGRKVDGKWIQAFSTVVNSRVALELDDPEYSLLAFSTRHPDKVIEIVKDLIGS